MELDHIAVGGATLDEAVAYVEDALGLPLQPGGSHAQFSTHNRLLGLADGLYLEAIAIDPEAPPPVQPRWFGLDHLSGAPRLVSWICRTPDLTAALQDLPDSAGFPVPLARGDLRWHMAVPADGVLPYDGIFPALIEWHGDLHPSAMLPGQGCALHRLVISHPCANDLAELLPDLRAPLVQFEPGAPGLMAEIETPHGLRTLT